MPAKRFFGGVNINISADCDVDSLKVCVETIRELISGRRFISITIDGKDFDETKFEAFDMYVDFIIYQTEPENIAEFTESVKIYKGKSQLVAELSYSPNIVGSLMMLLSNSKYGGIVASSLDGENIKLVSMFG
ncbi:hypothetical protein MHBO_005288 [Bonamia ostreae]|uniref:Uncharacterized protein n=1 Tax=Bonamia ostreae TaxID=126728 RepID=A0ABV2AER5_9EUKA